MSVSEFPTQQGLYFARSKAERDWFDWVVLVEGEAPFLRIAAVLTRSGFDGPYLNPKPGIVDRDCWGPQIEVPDAPPFKKNRK